jgi:hypothetical protein
MAPPLPVAISLRDFPEHASIIGDMLLGFNDLEFFMVDLVGQAIGDKHFKVSPRIIYRLRRANDRLQVADAILRPFMVKLRLHGQYTQWFGVMKHCRTIRNQYAHCGFSPNRSGRLTFANLLNTGHPDEDAVFEFVPIELGLLKEQQAYFGYALDVTSWLMAEARFRRDRRRKHRLRLPTSRAAPRLHSSLD